MTIGFVGRTETGTERTVEIGTAEAGAEGATGIGEVDVAGGATGGIPAHAAIPRPSKVSVRRKMGVQINGDHNKMHMCKKGITREKEDSGGPHEFSLRWSTLL